MVSKKPRRHRRHGRFDGLVLRCPAANVVRPGPAEHVGLGGADGLHPGNLRAADRAPGAAPCAARFASTRRTASSDSNSTLDVAKPGFTLDSLANDSTSRLPTNSTTSPNATWTATNGRITPVRVPDRPPPVLRAVIGATLEARSAGATPNSAVVSSVRPAANARSRQSMRRSSCTGSSGDASMPTTAGAGDRGEEQAEDARGSGHERAFDEHLLNQPAPAGADRQAQRHLALARRGAGQEQVGDVRAGDEEDQRRDRRQDPQRALELAPQRRRTVGRRPQEERRREEAGDALQATGPARTPWPRRGGSS